MLQDKLHNQSLPNLLKLLEERLAKTGSGHIAASGVSWADLNMINVLDFFGDKKDEILANYKRVKALDEKVRSIPNVAAWLNKRPKSDY